MEFNKFDILQAYWLFGSEYHSGQFSKSYAYMGRAEKCGFHPSPIMTVESLSDNARTIYDNLVEQQAPSRVRPITNGN